MENQQKNNRRINLETNKRNHHWFSATTGGINLQRRSFNRQNRSTPNLTPSSTAIASSIIDSTSAPSPDLLINAKFLVSLNKVASVQPMVTEEGRFSTSNVFQIHIKDQADVLYYEAPSTQIMLEWVALINTKLKMDPLSLIGHYNGFQRYQSRPEEVKHILVKKKKIEQAKHK